MQVLSLRLRGIGPFRSEQFIDFSQLGSQGLYLINGPTGAGKTTVIDAICFALYGDISAFDGDSQRLRCQFSLATELSEVDIVFEVNDGRFRVLRTPAYARPVKKGHGETLQKATCKLFRIDADGTEVELATTKGHADEQLPRLIGLDYAQFVQTIVLPQGEFHRFLKSPTQAREKVLKDIFKTTLYETVAEILASDSKSASAEGEKVTGQIKEILHAHSMTNSDEEKERFLGFIDDQLFDNLLKELRGKAPVHEQTMESAKAVHARVQAEFEQVDRARALAIKERLAVKAVSESTGKVASSETVFETATKRLTEHQSLADDLKIDLALTHSAATWRERFGAAMEARGSLAESLAAEVVSQQWPTVKAELDVTLANLREKLQAREAELNELPHTRYTLITTIQDVPTEAEITHQVLAETELENARGKLQELEDLSAAQAKIDDELRQAVEVARDASHEATKATTNWLTEIAASLASELGDNHPCPVCGSTSHPNLAKAASGAVSKGEVDALQRLAQTAQTRVVELEAQQKNLNEQSRRLVETLPLSKEEIDRRTVQINKAREAFDTRKKKSEAAEKELESLTSREETLKQDVSKAKSDLAVAQKELELKSADAAVKLSLVQKSRGEFPTVSAKDEAIAALIEAINAAALAAGNLESSVEAQRAAIGELETFKDHENFGNEEVANDLWKSADEARSRAIATLNEAQQELSSYSVGLEKIEMACKQRQSLQDADADLHELSKRFRAGTGSDIGLQTYVLRQLFENVIEAANHRFQTLLSGRFTFVLGEITGDQRSRLGLDLSVLDGLSGKLRPARTLSGGETFCASLALALGLADVVQMNAGGVTIGSLFIDEGFGSLDIDSLEDVMTMLHQLGRDGRQVGLISHVAEMKAAIADKIEVVRASQESPARLTVSWMN